MILRLVNVNLTGTNNSGSTIFIAASSANDTVCLDGPGNFAIAELQPPEWRRRYGLDAITDIGSSLEQSAKEQDSEQIRKLVGDLSTYLERLEVVCV